MIELTVDIILQSLKSELEREYGFSADWGYSIERNEDGLKDISIRLNVAENIQLNAREIGAVKGKIRDTLSNDARTAMYFPYVWFNVKEPAAASV